MEGWGKEAIYGQPNQLHAPIPEHVYFAYHDQMVQIWGSSVTLIRLVDCNDMAGLYQGSNYPTVLFSTCFPHSAMNKKVGHNKQLIFTTIADTPCAVHKNLTSSALKLCLLQYTATVNPFLSNIVVILFNISERLNDQVGAGVLKVQQNLTKRWCSGKASYLPINVFIAAVQVDEKIF